MKILFVFMFIFALVGSSILGVEAHDDHDHEIDESHSHSHETHHHSHNSHSKKSQEKTDDCSHVHLHFSALCLGVLIAHESIPSILSFPSQVSVFSYQKLRTQDISDSPYRPPIA